MLLLLPFLRVIYISQKGRNWHLALQVASGSQSLFSHRFFIISTSEEAMMAAISNDFVIIASAYLVNFAEKFTELLKT